jgi:hypothetical protein
MAKTASAGSSASSAKTKLCEKPFVFGGLAAWTFSIEIPASTAAFISSRITWTSRID